MITKPTHINPSSATLIDNIHTTSNTIQCSFIIQSDISDHMPMGIVDSVGISIANNEPRIIHDINKETIVKLDSILKNTIWDSVTNNNDTQGAFDSFFNLIKTATDVAFPLKTAKTYKESKTAAWMSLGLRTSSIHKDKLLKKNLKTQQ